MSMMLVLPLARLIAADGTVYDYLFYGVSSADGGLVLTAIPLASLLAAIPLISLISIFLYRNRILQIRLSVFNILLMVGALGLSWYYGFNAQKQLEVEVLYSIPAVMPLVSAILTYLAFRGIRRDELLIRSVERIRK